MAWEYPRRCCPASSICLRKWTARSAGRTADSGVGLALVRTLVEMHDGRVQAFSAGSNKGSEFTVILPVMSGTFEHEKSVLVERVRPLVRISGC